MVGLVGVLSHLQPFRVLVVGDFMLDRYTSGQVERISPEAPVPVLHVSEEHILPGGAGNVALNLASLGAQVQLLGRVGDDAPGAQLKKCLRELQINPDGLIVEPEYKTPIKNRLMAGGQQMLRIDFEQTHDFPPKLLPPLHEHIDEVDLIAISDYNKGFLTPAMLEQIIQYGKQNNIPIIVDPKGIDFSKYRGATLIKPNKREAYLAAGCDCETSLETVADQLLTQTNANHILITRSGDGLSLFCSDRNHSHFPVRTREINDVTGAGDTVLAMLAMGMANQLDMAHAAQLANVAASIAVEKLGCARLSLSDIAERLLELDSSNKVFGEQHLYALKQVLTDQPFTVLGIDGDEGMTTVLLMNIHKLSHPGQKLILYIRCETPDEDFIHLLTKLQEVDFIILKSESLIHLCNEIRPTRSYILENDTLQSLDAISAIL